MTSNQEKLYNNQQTGRAKSFKVGTKLKKKKKNKTRNQEKEDLKGSKNEINLCILHALLFRSHSGHACGFMAF